MVNRCSGNTEEVQRCRVQRCRDAEVQKCRVALVQMRCRGAQVHRMQDMMEMQKCRCRGSSAEVQRCR